MKHIHTPSQTFIAVRFETTGNVPRKLFEVVKKLSIVVTPSTKRMLRSVKCTNYFMLHNSNNSTVLIPRQSSHLQHPAIYEDKYFLKFYEASIC